jgi:hypothetical protein
LTTFKIAKHDKFWDESEDNSGEEPEGNEETFWDKYDGEPGEESLDHAANRVSENSARLGMGRNNARVINSDSLGVEGETRLNSKEAQEGEELVQQIGWMPPVKTATTKLILTSAEPTIERKEMVHELN